MAMDLTEPILKLLATPSSTTMTRVLLAPTVMLSTPASPLTLSTPRSSDEDRSSRPSRFSNIGLTGETEETDSARLDLRIAKNSIVVIGPPRCRASSHTNGPLSQGKLSHRAGYRSFYPKLGLAARPF